MRRNVLVVVAHPDDEVLGCGGAIVNHASRGDRVVVAILGQGKAAREDASASVEDAIKELRSEAETAAKILGVERLVLHDFPDNAMDTVPLLRVTQFVEHLKESFRPDIVYTHHHADINIDHQIVFKAVITAFRPIGSNNVTCIYSCEVPSATEWQAPQPALAFQPNVFFDIGDALETKKRALAAYQTELRAYPHPRSIEAIDIIGKRWGTVVGCAAAEPFVLVRSVTKGIGVTPRFTIRHAVAEDEAAILGWRNDPVARSVFVQQNIVSDEEHSKWYSAKLRDQATRMYIACTDFDEKLGIVRFEKSAERRASISINISPEQRGKGLGRQLLHVAMLRYFKENHDVDSIEAIVKSGNAASERMFMHAGFSPGLVDTVEGYLALRYDRKGVT